MPPTIRPATPTDLPAMVDLLIRGGEQRRSQNPALWLVDAGAPARIEAGVRAALEGPNTPAQERWLLAEAAGRLVGLAHAMIVQPPPIYDIAAGSPGLILDDGFTLEDAPPDTAAALLTATETAIRAAGAAGLIASCPAAGSWRAVYERHGYEPVTLYMAKAGFGVQPIPPVVRPAGPEDLAGIVGRSAEHRKMLGALNPRFWHIHPEADRRFEMWMRYSLTLPDRDMFAAGASDEVHGYVIAQPVSPLLVPAAHDIRTIGVIDDYYDRDFASVLAVSSGGTTAAGLLSAVESAFAQRGFTAALAVCPAAWTAKISLLEQNGYRTAKLWLLKR